MKQYKQEINLIDEMKQALEFLAWLSLMLNSIMGLIWFIKLFLDFIGLI